MEKQFLSISEYANIKGISKQAVYQQLNKKLKDFVQVVDNQKFISIQALDESELKRLEQPVEQEFNQVEQPVEQAFLISQLEEKDRQIDRLMKQIENLQELLNQSQRLQAADKQLLLEKKNKKGLLSLFSRKKEDTTQ